MRKAHSTQPRLDCNPINNVVLNFNCRDEIIPILATLQQIYSQPKLRDDILQLIAQDVNAKSDPNKGREGFDYWQILVLAAVRLGCNFDYDHLQDLAENHRRLRHMMGVGDWDQQTSFDFRRIRDNICLLRPETIERISHLVVAEAHRLHPDAAQTARVDSFVIETDIHYPTESSLIWDGLRKILELGADLADELGDELGVTGWRQNKHLWRKIKNLHREISRVGKSKKKDAPKQLEKLYRKLLADAKKLLARAEELVQNVDPGNLRLCGLAENIRTFIERTRQVCSTAFRRVICGQQVPNADKLFSVFESHTQLYRRGKAGQDNQFGRMALIYEDGLGMITHHYLMDRDEQDQDVAVPQTKIVQQRLEDAIKKISFDRGFYSQENEEQLKELIDEVCLPKRGVNEYAEQMSQADGEFRRSRQRHPGVESAIGALQSGNGLERSRDRSERGVARYLSLGVLGRNLHVLGKYLIASHSPDCLSVQSQRKAA